MEEPPNLMPPSQAQPIGNKTGKIHAFVSQSLLQPFIHTLEFSEPKRAEWKSVPIASANSASRSTATLTLPFQDGSGLRVGFASPYLSEPFCTEIDCPLSSYTHYKGFFLHDTTWGRVVDWHKDFGWSDPPPFLVALYCRATDCFDELHKNESAKEIFIDGLRENPPLDVDNSDEKMVRAFLRYHAVTLQDIEGGGKRFVPLKGEMLSRNDPKMVFRPKPRLGDSIQ
ncbi:MAG: hypothetical protein LQ343_005946 [Gyalolechia ehrenbergii]|nr:MAG: hypothetical protein LQ343_005946 [Gyalolechia ehrenbergii]